MGLFTMADCIVAGERKSHVSKADWLGHGAGRGAETLTGSNEMRCLEGVVFPPPQITRQQAAQWAESTSSWAS